MSTSASAGPPVGGPNPQVHPQPQGPSQPTDPLAIPSTPVETAGPATPTPNDANGDGNGNIDDNNNGGNETPGPSELEAFIDNSRQNPLDLVSFIIVIFQSYTFTKLCIAITELRALLAINWGAGPAVIPQHQEDTHMVTVGPAQHLASSLGPGTVPHNTYNYAWLDYCRLLPSITGNLLGVVQTIQEMIQNKLASVRSLVLIDNLNFNLPNLAETLTMNLHFPPLHVRTLSSFLTRHSSFQENVQSIADWLVAGIIDTPHVLLTTGGTDAYLRAIWHFFGHGSPQSQILRLDTLWTHVGFATGLATTEHLHFIHGQGRIGLLLPFDPVSATTEQLASIPARYGFLISLPGVALPALPTNTPSLPPTPTFANPDEDDGDEGEDEDDEEEAGDAEVFEGED